MIGPVRQFLIVTALVAFTVPRWRPRHGALMIRRRRIVIGAVAVLGILVALAPSPAAEEDFRRLLSELFIQVPSREVNAPTFSLPDARGAPVHLGDHKGRPVMLYFWTTY